MQKSGHGVGQPLPVAAHVIRPAFFRPQGNTVPELRQDLPDQRKEVQSFPLKPYAPAFDPGACEQRRQVTPDALCLALGVTSGLLLKFLWTGLSWEAGTFIQVGVALAAFWLGALFGTSARERASREALFRQLNGAEKGSKN